MTITRTPRMLTRTPLIPTEAGRRFGAVAAFVLLGACNPVSSRPAFVPYPEDLSVLLTGPVAGIAQEAGAWLESQGIHTEWVSAEDGYVESSWYDTDTHRSTSGTGDIGSLLVTFKLRIWVDPDAPGKSKLTVEAVYRPTLDPSRGERDLERIAPPASGGAVLVQRLVDEMQRKFGS